MDTLRAAIIDLRNSTADDDVFIKGLIQLQEEHGPIVCKVIFQTMTSLDIPRNIAVECWRNVLQHRQELGLILDRKVDLMTAMCDFLRNSTNYLVNPRLVDVSTFERVIHETMYDGLTGLCNRLYFDAAYKHQLSLTKRYHTDLSILFMDIDNFKELNDTLGHVVGDIALKRIGAIIQNAKRESDIAARFGGEEFVLLMPHTESLNAFILGERIRKEVEQEKFSVHGQRFRMTISGGLASYPLNSNDPKTLLEMADCATYLAKGAGKNNIAIYKKDQRRYLRVKLSQPVLVKELGFVDSKVYAGISKDICIGGILFENDAPLPIGATIQISVPINGDNPLLLIGTIVRVEAFGEKSYEIGMTISFKEMEKIANTEIAQFLKGSERGNV